MSSGRNNNSNHKCSSDGHQHDHRHDHHHEHSHNHSHGHGHHHHSITDNIRLALFLNFSFSIIELIGGIWIGSMAIVADAVHDFGDSISLGAAWFLEKFAKRSRDQKFNFGYRRFSLLSALISGGVVTAGSAVIIYESAQRFFEPQTPKGIPMIGFAVLGLAINGYAAWRLSKGETQNEKVLTWHLLEDVFGWAIVLVGAIIITLTGITWLDPLLAIGLALFISFNVIKHLRETAYLFLQGRPLNFNEERFVSEVLAIPGVEHIDHLAVWSLDGETSILSARLHVHDVRDPVEIENIKAMVREFAIRQKAQATLETCLAETAPHTDEV